MAGFSSADYRKVDALADALGARSESAADALGLGLSRAGRMLAGPCPVHGGDSHSAFNLYPEGDSVPGLWKCRSRSCHLQFKRSGSGCGTILGLVWGVLSHREAGWNAPGDARVPFRRALDWACKFLGTTLESVEVDYSSLEKRRFCARQEILQRGPSPSAGWPAGSIRRRIGSRDYYVSRGYREETLARYDVGEWLPGPRPSPMAGRIAVPVFDESHESVVGVTARSPFERCPACGLFHKEGPCPDAKNKEACKWLNNEGFKKEEYLYNYWFAKGPIRETGVAVLVEGPGDVWRIEEAGFGNSVAAFGCELSDPQQVILERSGAMTVVLLPHKDQAGEAFRRHVESELGRSYRLVFIDPEGKDVGEMAAEDVRRLLGPILGG